MTSILIVAGGAVLYVVDVIDEIPGGDCQVEAWKPSGVAEITEVFHARIVDYGCPSHCHDTWTVLIVDTGAIAYDSTVASAMRSEKRLRSFLLA